MKNQSRLEELIRFYNWLRIDETNNPGNQERLRAIEQIGRIIFGELKAIEERSI